MEDSVVLEDTREKSVSSDLIRGHINTIILRALYDGDKYGYEIIAEMAYFAQVEAKDPDNIENIDEIVSGVLNLSFSELNLTLFIPLLTLFSAIIGFDIYELKVKMINEQIAQENIDGYNNVLTKEKFEEKIAELTELYEQKVIDEAKYNKLKEDITDKYIKSKMQI